MGTFFCGLVVFALYLLLGVGVVTLLADYVHYDMNYIDVLIWPIVALILAIKRIIELIYS